MGNLHSPKFQYYWRFTIRLSSVIYQDTRWEVLLLWRDAVGKFPTYSRLGCMLIESSDIDNNRLQVTHSYDRDQKTRLKNKQKRGWRHVNKWEKNRASGCMNPYWFQHEEPFAHASSYLSLSFSLSLSLSLTWSQPNSFTSAHFQFCSLSLSLFQSLSIPLSVSPFHKYLSLYSSLFFSLFLPVFPNLSIYLSIDFPDSCYNLSGTQSVLEEIYCDALRFRTRRTYIRTR